MGEPAAIGDLLVIIGEKWRFKRRLPGGLMLRDKWEVVVGARMAAHCMPLSVAKGELTLAVDCNAWMQELTYALPQLERAVIAQIRAPKIKKLKLKLAPIEFSSAPQAGARDERSAEPLPEPTKDDEAAADLIVAGLKDQSLAEVIRRAYLRSCVRAANRTNKGELI